MATQPTPKESKAIVSSLITIIVICIAGMFCFSKMEKTTAETVQIAQLAIDKNRSETELILAKAGRLPEYRPIIVSSRSVVIGTSYQPSTTRYTDVSVSVQVSCALTLSGGATGAISLQTSPNNSTWTTVQQITNANSGTLVIGVAITNTNGGDLQATVSPGYYYRLTSTTTTGTPGYSVLNNALETNL